jgi:hypothetical protein
MDKISLPVRRADGRWTDLADLLDLIPDNDLLWSFLEFEGVGGTGPRGESILEFEELVPTSRTGYRLSWSELVRFAGQLEQTINCFLVAARTTSALERAADDFGSDAESVVIIEAVDSTTWELRAADEELSHRFSTFAAGARAD